MKSGIYAILNIYNEKYYVGSAMNLQKRWYEHLRTLKFNKHFNVLLQRTYNKYWTNPFIFTVLEHCDNKKLIEREQYWIDKLRPEYNLSPSAGNTFGLKISLAGRLNMKKPKSESHKNNLSKANLGKKHSLETKLKMSIAHKNRERLPDVGKLISKKRKGQKMKPQTNEHKNSIRLAVKNAWERKRKLNDEKMVVIGTF